MSHEVHTRVEQSLQELEELVSRSASADRDRIAERLVEHKRLVLELASGVRPGPGQRLLSSEAADRLLRALGEVSEASEDDSLAVALDSLMQLTSAQRGLIVLRSSTGSLSFPIARAVGAGAGPVGGEAMRAPEAQISRTILQAALKGETSVMVVDALADARFSRRDSVQALALRAVLAVPLVAHGLTLGALYLDNPIRAGAFSDEARRSAELFARIIGPIVERDLALREVDRRHVDRARELRARYDFSSTIGDSDALVDLLSVVGRVAPTDAAVLVTGETGTGKELVARNVHVNSRRAGRPYVAVNCGALPAELVESELFGHERGAFTGAHATRIGRFEAADGGTLFLDEVGELTLSAQAKLLRVLADGTFQRVGATETRRADVRLVTATNRDLDAAAAAGGFRHDLLYRLNVIRLHVPPLRERDGDIPLLVAHFVERFSRTHGKPALHVHPSAMAALEAHAWPGNVRELANVLERAVILASRDELTADLLDLGRRVEGTIAAAEPSGDMKSALRAYKRRLVARALESSKGDNAAAARLLGVHPKYMYQLLRELELGAPASEPPPPSSSRPATAPPERRTPFPTRQR